MWLKRIELKNFKRLVDFQAQFHPGINVVKGPLNEMGKSTLLEGIIAALFYNPKSTSREIRDYVSWGSTRRYQTSLEFEEKGNRCLLEKDFDKGTVRFIEDEDRGEIDTFKEVSEKVAELLGTKSDRLFLSSSCIRQSQVTEISSGEKEITASLEEVVSGGKESTLASQVIGKLDGKIADMKRGLDKLSKNPGILASLKTRLQDALQRYDEVRNEVSRAEAQKVELMQVEKQLARIKEEYEKSRALLEKNKQRKEIEASIKDLEQKYDAVEELLGGISELMTKLGKVNEALRSIEEFEDEQQVSELRRKLDAIQNSRGDIVKHLTMRESELAEAKGKLDRKKAARFFGSGSGIATALAVLIGGVIGALVVSVYFLGLVILGAAFLTITIRARTALIQDKTSISGIEKRIQDMKLALDNLGKEEKELLAGARCNTVGEFDKKEKDFKFRLKEKTSLEAQLKGMLRGRAVEDFEKQKRETARDLAVEKAKLTEDLMETRLSPEEYIELESKVRGLEEKQAELEKRKRYSEAIVKLAEEKEVDAERQIKLEEEVESLQKALKQEEKRVKIYELARDFISRARAETFLAANEILEKEIRNCLSIFTAGKYKQVRINKEGLELWVYSDEKGDWAKPEELSGGAVDELYLAFRLALVKLIFRDKKPPLLLDDPFVNFDSVRLANTLNFFKTLASDYQIIIFTLGDLYDTVADNIILLGENERLL
ncbi:MAG: AAA family ATPase [Dehalococcoidia bacterium]|nr:AAA family ATPase [Dehalococcoidia bacterium]